MANIDLTKLKIDKTKLSTPSLGRRKKRPFLWLLGIALIIVIILYWKGPLKPAFQAEIATASQMYPSQTFTLLNASGYIVAQRKAAVASKVTGRLVSLSVEEGSKVKEGQIIAQLENADVKATRDQAEANVNVARSKLEQTKATLYEAKLSLDRDKELLDRGFLPQAEYDTAEAKYKSTLAEVAAAEATVKASMATLQEAKVSLDYTFIRAPFDAVVLTKNADIGDIVTPLGAAANAKASVVTIADLDSLQVEVDVSESNLEKVKMGQPCEIQLDALPSSHFKGEVYMIVPTADRTKATVLVKVRFLEKDNRVLPEMSARVAFLSRSARPDEQSPRLVLNPKAIVTREGQKIVFLVKDNLVKETLIKIGTQLGDMTEILRGLKEGDKVVANPSEKLKDGDKVKIVE